MSAALPLLFLAALAAYGVWSALFGWARVTRREALARFLGFTRIATWFALAAGSALPFYDRYWVWRDCFNGEGRCSDSEAGVMVEEAGWIWGGLFVIFDTLLLRSLMTSVANVPEGTEPPKHSGNRGISHARVRARG